jgi:hypothetical protein
MLAKLVGLKKKKFALLVCFTIIGLGYWQGVFYEKFLVFKKYHEKTRIERNGKSHHNCLQYEMALEIRLLSCFESHQIWLNIVMDDHHWSNVTNISIY